MYNKINFKKTGMLLLILTAMAPSLGTFRLGGIYLNIERIILPAMALICLFNSIQTSYSKTVRRMGFSIILVLTYWILYGLFLTLISNYINLKESLKELSTIVFGVFLIFSFLYLCDTQEDVIQCISYAKVLLWFILFIAIIEMITGWHLPTSCYNDSEFIDSMIHQYGYVPAVKSATGFQYGVNDFAAFITFFSPLFYIKLNAKHVWINWVGWGLCFIITLRNDAIIAALSMLIGSIFYWIFKNHSRYIKKIYLILFGFSTFIASLIFIYGKNILLTWNLSSIIETVKVQLSNRNIYGSSSNLRIQIYIDTLKSVVNSRYMGVGPSALKNYFKVFPSASNLINPHNLWLEILSQYGILIFILYIVVLLYLGVRLYQKYQHTSQPIYLAVDSMLIVYLFVSLAPSTFLGYLYQWLGVAICVALLEKKRKNS